MLRCSRLLRSALPLLVLPLLLAAPAAEALLSTLTLDPTRSTLSFSGTASLDFGFPGDPSVTPIQSQLDFPTLVAAGAAGATIGDGSTSDGRRTSLTGSVEIDQTGDVLQILGAELTPDISGSWVPEFGLFASNAQLAGAFVDPTYGIGAELAIRFGELELVGAVLKTSVLANSIQIGADSVASARFTQGGIDYRTVGTFGEAFGTPPIPQAFSVTSLAGGALVETSPGQGELTLPLTASLVLAPEVFPVGLPLTVQLDFSGELVATGAISPIPEPTSAALLALGLIALSCRRAWEGDGR